ncbi:S24 family peptidase [Sphingobacterium allocomposti]|nr:S24 family peptidase [Sphingobacterium composti Yoo et al. 2007 non Ten et al. 2007]
MQSVENQGEKFKEFLKKIVKSKKVTFNGEPINMETAAKMLGYSKQNLYSKFKSKRLDYDSVKTILATFNVTEEELWGDDLSKSNARPAAFKGTGKPNMWVVPIKAQGGFLEGYGDSVLLEQNIEKVYFPFIGQECFAFEIDGLSMITEYLPGEYFVGTPIENFNHLVKGRVYVFQTIDGIILKEFVKIEGDYIYLRSHNEDYNPVRPIYLKEVKRVYQREMIIKN